MDDWFLEEILDAFPVVGDEYKNEERVDYLGYGDDWSYVYFKVHCGQTKISGKEDKKDWHHVE